MISLDSQCVFWGVQRKASPGSEKMLVKAGRLLGHLDSRRVRAIVPSVVMSEFLAGIPAEYQEKSLEVMIRRFIIPTFDVAAAALAGRIWADQEHIKALRAEDYEGRRQKLKLDVCILATAIVAGATVIISHDKGFKKLCGSRAEVCTLDEYKLEDDLFSTIR